MSKKNRFKNFHRFIKKHRISLGVFLVIFLAWFFCLPTTIFDEPTSTVLKSKENLLLGARIADDGQWRFPQQKNVPHRFKKCILYFEDKYFYKHPGFNPISISKAFWENITTNNRRGGSTITQQVIRLSRNNQKRTYLEKFIELFQATRLETRYSKDEILNLYATYAPFGGNIVGLETAAWRYFGIPAKDLSWGQSAALAVLPNAPALIFPGKNEEKLQQKRDLLLQKLHHHQVIDETTYQLALQEKLPQKPLPLPKIAPHLTEKARKEHKGKHLKSSISYSLQQQVNQLAKQHYEHLKQNEIHNLAILVLDVKTRKVLAYVGNSPTTTQDPYVDIIQRPRSTGSILKPFLFASLLDEGTILPESLIADVPTQINGYSPVNFDKKFRGAVPANKALAMSLNVPAVKMLQTYGLQKFYHKLQEIDQHYINKPADYYGLSLILGGAESSLWDITKAYAGMASSVNFYTNSSSEYRNQEFTEPSYLASSEINFGENKLSKTWLGAGAIYKTLNVLQEVNRPQEELNWQFFDNAQSISWKTGTSHGFKDAWAVGVNAKYAVGVWAGNADGEGRPGLTGLEAAAPLLFDVFKKLSESAPLKIPYDDLIEVETCIKSGQLAGIYCTEIEKNWIPKNGTRSKTCIYHKQVFLNAEETYQVNSSCYELAEMKVQSKFVLPPLQEFYYADAHPEYQPLPPFQKNCLKPGEKTMELIYPKKEAHLILPKNFNEKSNPFVLKLAHRNSDKIVYWYIDDTYMGKTENFHELSLLPKPGKHMLTIVDEDGNTLKQYLTIEVN
ncbi:penicillin-binding protein 1C [Mesonia aquimarina]|uniref:penicillin-binding protein 1C n=1 Tax=Mesonia aquimarina TaxID=1504967 RepID=UPI000EF577CD|nr:penicillin-binding protein 1C [Mesonia aquimarina]